MTIEDQGPTSLQQVNSPLSTNITPHERILDGKNKNFNSQAKRKPQQDQARFDFEKHFMNTNSMMGKQSRFRNRQSPTKFNSDVKMQNQGQQSNRLQNIQFKSQSPREYQQKILRQQTSLQTLQNMNQAATTSEPSEEKPKPDITKERLNEILLHNIRLDYQKSKDNFKGVDPTSYENHQSRIEAKLYPLQKQSKAKIKFDSLSNVESAEHLETGSLTIEDIRDNETKLSRHQGQVERQSPSPATKMQSGVFNQSSLPTSPSGLSSNLKNGSDNVNKKAPFQFKSTVAINQGAETPNTRYKSKDKSKNSWQTLQDKNYSANDQFQKHVSFDNSNFKSALSPISSNQYKDAATVNMPLLGTDSATLSPQNEMIFQEDLEEIKREGISKFALPLIGYAHRIKQNQNEFGPIQSSAKLRQALLSKRQSFQEEAFQEPSKNSISKRRSTLDQTSKISELAKPSLNNSQEQDVQTKSYIQQHQKTKGKDGKYMMADEKFKQKVSSIETQVNKLKQHESKIITKNFVSNTSGLLIEKMHSLQQESLLHDPVSGTFKPGYQQMLDDALELKRLYEEDNYTSTMFTEKSTQKSEVKYKTGYVQPKAVVETYVFDQSKQDFIINALAKRRSERQKMKGVMSQIQNQIGGVDRVKAPTEFFQTQILGRIANSPKNVIINQEHQRAINNQNLKLQIEKNDQFRDQALEFLTRQPTATTKYSDTPKNVLSPFERKKKSVTMISTQLTMGRESTVESPTSPNPKSPQKEKESSPDTATLREARNQQAREFRQAQEKKKISEIYIQPYLDPSLYTRDKMLAKQKEIYTTEWMYKEAFRNITNDQKVISLILLQNDGEEEIESHSKLMNNWKKIQGAQQQTSVTRYLRVLTGANKEKETLELDKHNVKSMALSQNKIETANKAFGKKSLLNRVIDLKKEKPKVEKKQNNQEKNDMKNYLGKILQARVERQTSYHQDFENYVDHQQDVSKRAAELLTQRIEFFQLAKNSQRAATQTRYATDPRLVFFNQCDADHDLVLPLLQYVEKKALCLKEYTLSIGHCRALAKSCPYFGNLSINRIMFDNCGIDDEEFAAMLEGLDVLKDFKKIIYRYNVFGPKSLRNLKPLLSKKIPNHLEELRIENCKMGSDITYQLIDLLNEKHSLSKLALVNINISEDSFYNLCDLVENSPRLEELDISWAAVKVESMGRLIEIISKNKKLQYLNLSWCKIVEEDEDEQQLEILTKFASKAAAFHKFAARLEANAPQEIQWLCNFIKRNKNLIHLDLSHTNLSSECMWHFAKGMRRSKNLRAIHLSGNPGINQKLIEDITKRIRGVIKEKPNIINFRLMPSNISSSKNEKREQKELRPIQEETRDDYSTFSENKQLDQVNKENSPMADLGEDKKVEQLKKAGQLQQLMRAKHQEIANKQEIDQEKKVFYIQRILGHKLDIPGIGQWQVCHNNSMFINHEDCGKHSALDKECFVCDKDVYSIIFWNEAVGAIEAEKFTSLDKDFFMDNLKRINGSDLMTPLEKEGPKRGCPMIYGTFTNWKPKRMFEIREYCEMINKDKPNIYQLCKDRGIIPQKSPDAEYLPPHDMRKYQNEVKFYYESYKVIWRDIVQKYLKYKKPNLVNAEKKEELNNYDLPLYILPVFMKSGTQNYMVKYQNNQTQELKFFPGSCIAKFRDEEIFLFEKQTAQKQKVRKFIKETSVFAKWKKDDNLVYKRCFEHDVKYWKMPKVVKDRNERERLYTVIQKRMPELKAQFMYMASRSLYPAISLMEFSSFVRKANFIDKFCTSHMIDSHFVAVNFEAEDQGENPDKALIRFEFIEILVRIARDKYLKSRIADNIIEAFEMLMDNNFLPGSNVDEWQTWRENELWTVEVNDVLSANKVGIEKVINFYTSQNSIQKFITFNDMVDLFQYRSDVNLVSRDVAYNLGMSKQTVVLENEEDGKKYQYATLPEFMEMIGRVAVYKFKGSELENESLASKIEQILDDLFVLIPGLKRKEVAYEDLEETESDTDY